MNPLSLRRIRSLASDTAQTLKYLPRVPFLANRHILNQEATMLERLRFLPDRMAGCSPNYILAVV